MKTLACLLLLFAQLATAQATDPKLSDATHARIRDVQLQQESLKNQYVQLQQALDALTDAAYKEAGVKREDWTLDMGTLKFAKVEKKPEAKKP